MCQWCGAPNGLLTGFSIVERPAQSLVGRVWEGTYSQAAKGALHPVLKDVQGKAGVGGMKDGAEAPAGKAGANGAGPARAKGAGPRRAASVPAVSTLWAGPIVGISWNDRPDGFRYFVGLEDEGKSRARRGELINLPAMRFAAAWHDAGDGEVIDHYQAMLEWIEREGLRWDKSRMHHREEYPLHADFDAPPVLRLMVPVVG